MSTVTMSVHEGLAKLKLYDQKINQMLRNVPPMTATIRNKDTTVYGVTKEQFKINAESFIHSFNALMENKAKLKGEIVKSNATTLVTIGGVEYTVADAIERKKSMNTLGTFNSTLTYGFNTETDKYNNACDRFQTDFERFLTSLGGDTNKRKVEEIDLLRKSFEEQNGSMFYNPLDIAKVINANTETYDEFLTEVDFRLSESNALTKITVDFVD